MNNFIYDHSEKNILEREQEVRNHLFEKQYHTITITDQVSSCLDASGGNQYF